MVTPTKLAGAAGTDPDHLCNHGIWPDCGLPRGIVPDPYPLHVDVIALPHW